MSDLAEFIRDWTLFDPVDATAGLPKSATKVQPTKIRSWKLKRVHFTLDPTLLVSLERRLDQLPLHQPAPTDIGQPNSDVGTIWEEPHVVALLDSELIPTVRRLLHRNGILRAWQTFPNSRESGIPDLFLIDEEITLALSKIEPVRFGEIKTGRHLRTVVKNLFLWLQRREELVMNVTSLGKSSLEMDQCYGDLGDDTTAVIRERTDKLLYQVVNEFFSNPTASHGLVTDISRYFVVKKTGGTINGEANFALSLPIGNRGPLNLSSLVNDLSPLPAALPLLVHKPLGLMLALSLDEDTPPSTSLASSIPVVAPQPDRVKLGGEGSGSRARESTRSSARIAEAVPTSKGVAKKLVLQSITPSEEGPESDSGQPGDDGVDTSFSSSEDDPLPTTPVPVVTAADLGLNEFSVSLDLFSDQPHVSQYILPSRLSPGKLFGPYIPSPESSSRIVPQILSPARYYRPDSPELDLAAKDHDSPTHPATKRPKTGSLASLSLIQSIGSGRLWDAFRASATLFPQNGVEPLESLVFKLACPLLLPSQPTNDTYSELQARAAILHEDWIYRGPLKSMQKTLVPAYHGLWGGEWSLEGRSGYERDVWCCLLEDVGEAVDMGTLSEDGKREILDLYAQLHRAGVVHNDVAPHHWRRRPSDGICLIDFDSGIIRGNVTEEEWDELVVGEIEEVMAMLA